MSSRRKSQKLRRGAATVEFALIVPIFITMMLWSSYLLEIVRMRLKMQEAARYVTWEMTSYALTDFETANHPAAYQKAMDAVMTDAKERYKDFDSVEPNQKAPFYSTYGAFDATMKDNTIPFITAGQGSAPNGGNQLLDTVLNFVNQGANAALGLWKFNTKGNIEVEITGELKAPFMPKGYNDSSVGLNQNVNMWGGKNLASRKMKAKFAMIANGWHLKDGSDAMFNASSPARAGVRTSKGNHSMFEQVRRMTYFGLGQLFDKIPGIDIIKSVLGAVAFPVPLPPNAYVISHNYLPEGDNTNRNCNNTMAQAGQNNLADGTGNFDTGKKGKGPGLDYDDLRCFGTAPFRDTQAMAKSLYMNVWKARGEFGMGCKKEQATDPTWTSIETGDKADPYGCQ